ncbi:type II toxin-antitoxin system RelE/ParE family toxin [Paraburkholderia xenovorans]|uniref:type II toxin-antitoxin system RelE/ParE family toxin n=1 Tax=Paraburkholderia xenovorans TaxID=36873 RepID=UPI0038B960E6
MCASRSPQNDAFRTKIAPRQPYRPPFNTNFCPGAREIRIRDADGAFRIIYVAKFDDAVHVLHRFQKKTPKTSKADLQLAAKRYREMKEAKA